MTNDNEPDNVVSIKPKAVAVEKEMIANVFVKEGLIGLGLKDGLIFLNPAGALELCMVLVAAIQVAKQFNTED